MVSYLFGLLQAKDKNMERMEETVEGFDYQAVQYKISEAGWDHRAIMDAVAVQTQCQLGLGRKRLVLDDSGFEKKGKMSVGVARQYNGRQGKVDNCQIAVCASLASGQRSSLIDCRLYLPEEWTENPERCAKAGIPEDQRAFKTKAELALEIVRHQRCQGIDFQIVSMDSGYGSQHPLLHHLDGDGESFVAEVHCDQHVWTQAPWMHTEGLRPGTRLNQPRASHPSQRVDHWIAALPDTEWRRVKVRDSNQGWVEASYIARRIWVVDGDREKVWWLLAWEDPDEVRHRRSQKRPSGPRRHYALSNASADEDPRELVSEAVERNVVERNFREAKSDLGMADYQVRGWTAWHHHMALVLLIMLFVLQEKMLIPLPEGHVDLTAGDIVFMLERILPTLGYGQANKETAIAALSLRLSKRQRDQERRRRKTAEIRPPLAPDELRAT